ncbi:MAG: carboxypeptidase-like regulatory domain-containing protein, partial [Bacteroidales bacterium]
PQFVADIIHGDIAQKEYQTLVVKILNKLPIEGGFAYKEDPESGKFPQDYCWVKDTVRISVGDGFKVGGRLTYNGDTARPVGNARILLSKLDKTLVDSTRSDRSGNFTFAKPVEPSTYVITGESEWKTYDLINAITANDASLAQSYGTHSIDRPTEPLDLAEKLANVNEIGDIDENDASAIQSRSVKITDYFTGTNQNILSNWIYSIDTIQVTNHIADISLRTALRGDPDTTYYGVELENNKTKNISRKIMRVQTQRFKASGQITLDERTRIIDYPIISLSEGEAVAFQLFMSYPAEDMEILGLSTPVAANLAYNIIDNQILFNWVSAPSIIHIAKGDTMAIIKLKLKAKPRRTLYKDFAISVKDYQVSTPECTIYPDWEVGARLLDFDKYTYTENPTIQDKIEIDPPTEGEDRTPRDSLRLSENEIILDFQPHHEVEVSQIIHVIPNPMSEWADVSYSVSGDCMVSLKLFTLVGECVQTLVESERQNGMYRKSISGKGLSAGIYVLRLETNCDGRREIDIVKVIIRK